MRITRILSIVAVVPFAVPAPALAHRKHFSSVPTETYTAFKAGGYDLDSLRGSDGTLDGLYLGFELGASPSPFFEVGFSVDWVHRRQGNEEILIVDAPYELPVNGVLELDGTSTDLVPFGGVARLRFPVSDGRFVPYVSGQLTYDVLRLEYREIDGDTHSVSEQDEFFHGLGTTVSFGLESRLDSKFGLLVELGVHESKPNKDLTIGGVPVKGEVDAGGGFVRFGMRLAFH